MPRSETNECCPVMQFVLERTSQSARPTSLSREVAFNLKTGAQSTMTVVHLPKAKRDDKSEFAKASYAVVKHCPFCGAAVTS